MNTGDRRTAAGELAERLVGEGVRIARIIHPDLYGCARSKQFPVELLPGLIGGIGYCKASLVEGLDGFKQPVVRAVWRQGVRIV